MSSLSYVPERGTYRLRLPEKVHHTPGGKFRSKEFGGNTANPHAVRSEVLTTALLPGFIVLVASKISPEDLMEHTVTELTPGQKYHLRDVLIFLLKTEFGQHTDEYDEETIDFMREQLRNHQWVIPALFECLENNLITVEFGAPEYHQDEDDSNVAPAE